jgi:hypothetical protein
MKKSLLAPVLLLLLSVACLLYAQEILPAKMQSVLIIKTLGYIKDAGQINTDGKVLIGILTDDTTACATFSRDILENILTAKSLNHKVLGLEIEPMLFKYDKEDVLSGSLKNRKIKALYIVTQNDDNLKVVLRITKQLNILSMIGIKTEESVKKGVSIGFGMVDNKPMILINSKSIKSEQKEFSKDFYPLTKTIE